MSTETKKGKTIRKSNANTNETKGHTVDNKTTDNTELTAAPAKSIDEALGNVLLEIPKSSQDLVSKGTHFLMRSVMTDARNIYQRGKVLAEIKAVTTVKAFNRLTLEVWSRFNLNRIKITRWIQRYTVISVTFAGADDLAIDAFLTVTDGQNVIDSPKDGEDATLAGAYVAALRKHPIPKKGTAYDVCLDWAREVQMFAEKRQPNTGSTAGDVLKACVARFKVLLNGRKSGRNPISGNLSMATEAVVTIYRMLEVKSEPAALAAFAALENSDISAEQAGKNAMVELKHAQVSKAAGEAHEALEESKSPNKSKRERQALRSA